MGEITALRISDLAASCGVSTDTVRYYEREGLLPPPTRLANGYRAYGDADVDRLTFIHGAARLGLRLAEIRDLLAIRDTGVCPCEPAGELLRSRIAEIDEELRRLVELRAQLTAMADALPSDRCPDPVPGRWCPPVGAVTVRIDQRGR